MPTPDRIQRLRRLPRLARLFAVALVMVGGCRSVHPGVLVEHRPGDSPKACPVPYAATYLLQSVDDTGTVVVPLERCAIQHKYQVGFIREADGGLVAYAGGRKFHLPEGHYFWEIAPETARTRGDLTHADVSKVLSAAGKALVYVGAGVALVAVQALAGFAKSGGHN